MANARWEPFRDLAGLQDRVNRMFEDVITRPCRGVEQEEMTTGQWSPPVDIFETAESMVIRVEVPGLEQEALDVKRRWMWRLRTTAWSCRAIGDLRKWTDAATIGSSARMERSVASFRRR